VAVRWRRLHRRANGDGDQRERTARNPFTKRALRPYNQALKHRLEDASWRGVLYSHYGLRLIVFRTATLLMRRLLVWCERLSCSSELVVVMSIVRGRGAVESCGRKPGNRPRGTRSSVRIRARDEVARREAGRREGALCVRSAVREESRA
jgi:hypothetical protein